MVSHRMFKSLIYFKLVFVTCAKERSDAFSTCDFTVFQNLLLKTLSFLQRVFLTLLLNVSWLHIWGFTSGFSILFHYSSLKSRNVMPQHCSISWLLWLFTGFCGFIQIWGQLFHLVKMGWNFDKDCIEHGFG